MSQRGTRAPRGAGQTQAAQDSHARLCSQGRSCPGREAAISKANNSSPGSATQLCQDGDRQPWANTREGGEQWSCGKRIIYSRGHVRLLLLWPDSHLPAATGTPRLGGGGHLGQQPSKEKDSGEGNSQLQHKLDASVRNTAAMKSMARNSKGGVHGRAHGGGGGGTPGIRLLSAERD